MQYLISKNHVGLEFIQIKLILTIDVNNTFYRNRPIKISNSQDQLRSSHFVG